MQREDSKTFCIDRVKWLLNRHGLCVCLDKFTLHCVPLKTLILIMKVA